MQERRVERTEVVQTPRDAYPDDRYAGGRTERPERVGEPDLVTREADIRAADVPAGAAVDEVRATAYDPYAERRQTSSRLVQGIWLLFGVIFYSIWLRRQRSLR